MDNYANRDIQFCATCKWIRRVAPHQFVCERLGYRTHPRWKFRCWSPRDRYTSGKKSADERTSKEKDQ